MAKAKSKTKKKAKKAKAVKKIPKSVSVVHALKLAPGMKAFAREYLSNGMNPRLAAISAGYSVKSAASKGSQLAKNEKVLLYIEYLQQNEANVFAIDFHAQLKKLEKVLDKAMLKGSFQNAIASIVEQNKMMGFHAPEKSELNVNGDESRSVQFKPRSVAQMKAAAAKAKALESQQR